MLLLVLSFWTHNTPQARNDIDKADSQPEQHAMLVMMIQLTHLRSEALAVTADALHAGQA